MDENDGSLMELLQFEPVELAIFLAKSGVRYYGSRTNFHCFRCQKLFSIADEHIPGEFNHLDSCDLLRERRKEWRTSDKDISMAFSMTEADVIQAKKMMQSQTMDRMLNSYTIFRDKFERAGFVHNPNFQDFMACVDCLFVMEYWTMGVDPLFEHYKASPDCPFFTTLPNEEHDKLKSELENYNSRVKKSFTCIICEDSEQKIFLSCGHGYCKPCVSKLDDCSLCREIIFQKFIPIII